METLEDQNKIKRMTHRQNYLITFLAIIFKLVYAQAQNYVNTHLCENSNG